MLGGCRRALRSGMVTIPSGTSFRGAKGDSTPVNAYRLESLTYYVFGGQLLLFSTRPRFPPCRRVDREPRLPERCQDQHGVLVQPGTEEVGRIVGRQMDVGVPLQAGLVLPSGVGEPVLFAIVARRPLGELGVLQEQAVLQGIERSLHPGVAGRQNAGRTDQRFGRLHGVPVQPADVGAAPRPPPTPRPRTSSQSRPQSTFFSGGAPASIVWSSGRLAYFARPIQLSGGFSSGLRSARYWYALGAMSAG